MIAATGTSIFPTGTPQIDIDYLTSREALTAGEETGASGEALNAERWTAAGWHVFTSKLLNCGEYNPSACTTEFSEALVSLAESGFMKAIWDAFVPKLRLYVEVKSGSGLLTDSIDAKIYAKVHSHITFGMGDIPQPDSALDRQDPPHFLLVLVGTKQHSAWVRLTKHLVETIVNGTQPATEDQRERAKRWHIMNIEEMTPAALDRLSSTIQRYNASL